MFEYRATLLRVIDGDTVELAVDLGFQLLFCEKFRLNRINAPELRGPERASGIRAREWLQLKLSGTLTIKTIKDRKEKYGRYLVEIYSSGECINDLMVHEGFANYATYS